MSGVPGAGGRVPKRPDQRRRRNAVPPPDVAQHVVCEAPEAPEDWHPLVRAWYASLSASGQQADYQASDWSYALLWGHFIDGAVRSGRPSSQMVARGTARAPASSSQLATAVASGSSLSSSRRTRRRRTRWRTSLTAIAPVAPLPRRVAPDLATGVLLVHLLHRPRGGPRAGRGGGPARGPAPR